jgi:hypothetical protein
VLLLLLLLVAVYICKNRKTHKDVLIARDGNVISVSDEQYDAAFRLESFISSSKQDMEMMKK